MRVKKIISDSAYVSSHVDNITSGLAPLGQILNLNQDLETNLSGNIKSHQLHDEFKDFINQFVKFLERDLENVNTIAYHFETMDKNMSSKIDK